MRQPVILTSVAIALGLALGLGQWLASLQGPGHGQWHERRIVYQLEARNETARLQRDRVLEVFVPPDVEHRQQRLAVKSNRPVEVTPAPGGNALARVELGDVPPYGARQVRLDVRLRLRDRVAAADENGTGGVTRSASTRFPLDAPALERAAERLYAGGPLATLEAIHDWVAGHIEASGYLAGDRGALYALREGKGDCTEFMSLAAALALRAGMAVRAVGGFPYGEDRVAAASQFHNWAEVLAGGRWWVVDAQTGTFTDRTDGHVIVRRLASPETADVGSQGLFLPLADFDVRMR